MRLLRTALATVTAVAAISGTSVVAFAYPTPTHHHEIHCQPGSVDAQGGSCSVVFKDQDKDGNARAYQEICFTVQGPGTVVGENGNCSMTDSKGVARATYYVGSYPADCANAGKDGHSTVTIYGQESGANADEQGAAATKVQIKCPKTDNKPPKGHDASNGGQNGSSQSQSANGANSAAHLATDPASTTGGTTSGTMLGIGILGFILALSVAITGRLRLRRLRR